MKKIVQIFITLCLAIAVCCQAQIPQEVLLNSGRISGTNGDINADVRVFKGIPYAAAPVGENRWRTPQAVAPWSGTRSATEFGPRCVQSGFQPAATQAFTSEDCLYLNVWTKAETPEANLPVMLWLYGGGFFGGAGSDSRYNGEMLAQKDAVIVTFNYRLGTFGFFAHPELSAESPQGISGNYALLDAIAALRWIQQNIAAFGGDPDNVTIFGESAGARLSAALVASPAAEGLFHRAILQSSAWMGLGISNTATLADGEGNGAREAELFGYSSLKTLRKLDTTEVFTNFPTGGAIRVDGVLIPRDLSLIFNSGSQNKVDLLIGSNHDEATFFGPGIEAADAFIASGGEYGALADDFLRLYPAASDEEARASYLRSFSDKAAWHMRLMADKQREAGKNSWVYYMTYVPPGFESRGATHTAELSYMFNLKPGNANWTEYDERLADQMSSYWVNFARTGNPNGQKLPVWPMYEGNTAGNVMILGDDVEAETDLQPSLEVLEFFDSVYERHLEEF